MDEEDLKRKSGVNQRTLKRYLEREDPPESGRSVPTVQSVADSLGVTVNWLRTGEGEMLAPAAGDGAREPQAARYDAETPASPSSEAGDVKRWRFSKYQRRGDAGDGATSDHVADLPPEEAGGVVEIVRGREEVKVASGYDADELEPLFVAGNSMEPKIRANTPALYVPMDDINASGIYYLEIDQRRIIKTVNVLAGGALKITSYNTEEYPEQEVLLPSDNDQAGHYESQLTGLPVDLDVIGRVVMYTCVT